MGDPGRFTATDMIHAVAAMEYTLLGYQAHWNELGPEQLQIAEELRDAIPRAKAFMEAMFIEEAIQLRLAGRLN
jgi:hypothetical protein